MGEDLILVGNLHDMPTFHENDVVTGVAGEAQYTDARVFNPQVAAVRERVVAEADAGLRDDEAGLAVTLADGRRIAIHVEHALGSVDNPMSDRELERKFIDLAGDTLSAGRAEQLIERCWKISALADAAELARLAVP